MIGIYLHVNQDINALNNSNGNEFNVSDVTINIFTSETDEPKTIKLHELSYSTCHLFDDVDPDWFPVCVVLPDGSKNLLPEVRPVGE